MVCVLVLLLGSGCGQPEKKAPVSAGVPLQRKYLNVEYILDRSKSTVRPNSNPKLDEERLDNEKFEILQAICVAACSINNRADYAGFYLGLAGIQSEEVDDIPFGDSPVLRLTPSREVSSETAPLKLLHTNPDCINKMSIPNMREKFTELWPPISTKGTAIWNIPAWICRKTIPVMGNERRFRITVIFSDFINDKPKHAGARWTPLESTTDNAKEDKDLSANGPDHLLLLVSITSADKSTPASEQGKKQIANYAKRHRMEVHSVPHEGVRNAISIWLKKKFG